MQIPVVGLSLIAVVALILEVLSGILLAALSRLTRAQAEAPFATETGGKYIRKIADRRPAAVATTAGLRLFFALLFAISLTLVMSELIHHPWVLLGAVAAAAVIFLSVLSFVLPARLGYKNPALVIKLTGWLLWPLTRIGSVFVTAREPDDGERENEEEQLAVMVERVSESEVIEEDEREMLHSVFEMSRTLVREVMVPRTDMISVGVDESLDRVLALFSRSGFSRVPVVGETVDDLLGVVYLKDVIKRTHRRSDADEVTVRDIMREPVFVPEMVLVDDLLHMMQRDSVHIALVVDEYGGIAGLVTIEDLLEELVGEMVDEHDRAEAEPEALADGSWRVPARMPIDDLGDLFDIQLEDDDVDTAGGLLNKAIGRVPIAGSVGEIAGLKLRADRFEGRRRQLSWLIVSRIPVETEDE
ncbi:MAG: hemolysin family protein [Trueperella sp.]|nr:hemolysin family protein [Trueperella sp.]